jgi:dihydrolipoamide dehydrogenase
MKKKTADLKLDVAVVGAGTAGLYALHSALRGGARALAFDPGPLGTTCARVGCMPSKQLIAAAEAAHHALHAGAYGVKASVKVDGAAVMRAVRRARDGFVGGMMEEYRDLLAKKLLVKERVVFTGPHTLLAGGREYSFKAAVIAVGSETAVPPPYRPFGRFLLTREEIFELKKLPASLLVVGAGLIGLELGQAFSRLGVRVTVLGLDRLLGPLSDPELREEAIKIFSREFDLVPHHELLGLKESGGKLRVSFKDASGKARSGVFEKVLMAAGQRPALGRLGLEKTGLPLDERGLPQTDPSTMRAGDTHFFLAGDAEPFRPALHEAAFEGRLAGRNAAAFPEVGSQARYCRLGVAFTDPQLAVAGKSPGELPRGAFCAGSFDYRYQGRARIMNAGYGRIKLYAEKATGRLLGAEIAGPRAEHTAHELAWSIERGLTAADLLRLPFYHPVLEEGLKSALEDLSARLKGRRPCAAGE